MPSCKVAILNGQCLLDLHITPPAETEVSISSDKTMFSSLLDTGAKQTGISKNVIKKLGLKSKGIAHIKAINRQENAKFYEIHLILSILRTEGNKQDLMLRTFQSLQVFEFAMVHHNFDVLLGMDVLSQCDFHMGHGEFTLGF